jgi:hypothetical protein
VRDCPEPSEGRKWERKGESESTREEEKNKNAVGRIQCCGGEALEQPQLGMPRELGVEERKKTKYTDWSFFHMFPNGFIQRL